MSEAAAKNFEMIVHLMAGWAVAWQSHILQHGTRLDAAQTADALCVGVASPERVRVLTVPNVPMPHYPLLFSTLIESKLFSPEANGLTLGYGVFIKADCFGLRYWVSHELAHVAQYEKFGGLEPCLRQYLHECLTDGYAGSALEREAHHAALECLRRDAAARSEMPYLFLDQS